MFSDEVAEKRGEFRGKPRKSSENMQCFFLNNSANIKDKIVKLSSFNNFISIFIRAKFRVYATNSF